MSRNIIIIGAGASGIFAAIHAAERGAAVTVLEQNSQAGKKILASGNGRCNFTNLAPDPGRYRSDDPSLVRSVMRKFTVTDTLSWFRGAGLLYTEKDGWCYPRTGQAQSVLRVLLLEAERLGVRFKFRESVKAIRKTEEGYCVETGGWQYNAGRVIVSCGSPASAVEGSSGSAAEFADALGIPAQPFLPALTGLRGCGSFFPKWAGIRIHGSASLEADGTIIQTEEGELQLTDYGISGIPVFQISGEAVQHLSEGAAVRILLDFCPEETRESLESELKRRAQRNPGCRPADILSGILPERLIPLFTGDNDLQSSAQLIKQFPVAVRSIPGFRNAQVCSGGINASGLTENMESVKMKGLYFTGEAVNCYGPCGGYNLQWAWSSGYAAGCAAADER